MAVEVPVAEATVERFDPTVLPGAAWIDEHGVGPVEAAPVGQRVGDELRPVIEAHVGRSAAFSSQTLEACHHAVGVDGPLDVDGQAFAAVLVDDVQELEVPSICCLVEGEVEGPHHVGPDRAEGTDGHPDAVQRALALSIGHTQAFCPPEAVDPLVVDRPAGVSGGRGGASPTPAGAAESEVTQEGPQGEFLVPGDRRRQALGGAGLADHATGPPF